MRPTCESLGAFLHDPRTPATFQPYHESWTFPGPNRERPLVHAVEKLAERAVAKLIHELRAQGLTVVGLGIVGSAERDLSKIGNYHIRAHAAEGLLFRRVLEFAAQANRLPHQTFAEKSLFTQAALALGITEVRLNNQLKSIGQAAGPPWRTDQRIAATASWLALSKSYL